MSFMFGRNNRRGFHPGFGRPRQEANTNYGIGKGGKGGGMRPTQPEIDKPAQAPEQPRMWQHFSNPQEQKQIALYNLLKRGYR